MAYCEGLVSRPTETALVLITDLYEGGNAVQMLGWATALKARGVQVIRLLALNDEGAPSFNAKHVGALAALEIPCFACTPDRFPDLMAAALQKQDVGMWAAQAGLTMKK